MNFIQTEFDFEGTEKMDNDPQKPNIVENNNIFEPSVLKDLVDDKKTEELSEEDEICEEIDDSDCLVVESTDDENSASKIKIEGDAWINEDLVPVTKIKCYVTKELYNAIRSIESCVNKKFGSSNEFSIYIHGELDEEGDLIVSPDYYIPKQKVGGASVDYLEEPEKYYNGCLHKHPSGCTSFSGVDKKYINSNFEFSLLYVNSKINMGIINIKYCGNRRVQIPLNIITEEEEFQAIDIANITKHDPRPKDYMLANAAANKTSTPKMLLPGFPDAVEPTLIQPTVFNGAMSNDEIDMETDMEEYFNNLGYRDI